MGSETSSAPVLRAAYDAIGHLDADALVAVCDSQVSFESPITAVDAGLDTRGSYAGYAGVRRYIANLAEAFEEIVVVQSGTAAGEGWEVATNHWRARGRGSGLEVEQEYHVGARTRGGRLVWWGFFDSESAALDAVRAP